MTVTVPPCYEALVADAKLAIKERNEAQARLSNLTRDAIEALRDKGMSYRDIGYILGISHQRVSQIARGK